MYMGISPTYLQIVNLYSLYFNFCKLNLLQPIDFLHVIINIIIHCSFSQNEDQVTALFMKIDSSSDGEINWVS